MARSAGLALGLLAVLATSQAGAQSETFYRWKDERGQLVVSDRPPQDASIQYEVVSQKSPLIRRVPPGEGAVPPEVTPRPGNEFEQTDPTAEVLPPKDPEACARARSNLQTLDSAARIRIRDEASGDLRFLTDEERETQRQRAEEVIRVACEDGA